LSPSKRTGPISPKKRLLMVVSSIGIGLKQNCAGRSTGAHDPQGLLARGCWSCAGKKTRNWRAYRNKVENVDFFRIIR
jgi:hypothetical protein